LWRVNADKGLMSGAPNPVTGNLGDVVAVTSKGVEITTADANDDAKKWDIVPVAAVEFYDMMKSEDNPLVRGFYYEELMDNHIDVMIGSSVNEYREKIPTVKENLYKIADTLDNLNDDVGNGVLTGGTFQLAGGLLLIAGLLMAPFTAGSSAIATATITATVIGTGMGLGGALTSLTAGIIQDAWEYESSKDAQRIIAETYHSSVSLLNFMEDFTQNLDERYTYMETPEGAEVMGHLDNILGEVGKGFSVSEVVKDYILKTFDPEEKLSDLWLTNFLNTFQNHIRLLRFLRKQRVPFKYLAQQPLVQNGFIAQGLGHTPVSMAYYKFKYRGNSAKLAHLKTPKGKLIWQVGSTPAKALQRAFAVVSVAFGIADVIEGVDQMESPHDLATNLRKAADSLEQTSEWALEIFDAFASTCGSYGNNSGGLLEKTGAFTSCECRALCSANKDCRGWTFVDKEGEFDLSLGVDNCILRSSFGAVVDNCSHRACRSGTPGTCGVNGNNAGTELRRETTETACACNVACSGQDGCAGWTWNSASSICTLRSTFGNIYDDCNGKCTSGAKNMNIKSATSLSAQGVDSCDTGMSPSEENCLATAQGLIPTGLGSGGLNKGYWTHLPRGCSVRSGSDWKVFYNTFDDGSDLDKLYSKVCTDRIVAYYKGEKGTKCPGQDQIDDLVECNLAHAELELESDKPALELSTTETFSNAYITPGCSNRVGSFSNLYFNALLTANAGSDLYPVCKKTSSSLRRRIESEPEDVPAIVRRLNQHA